MQFRSNSQDLSAQQFIGQGLADLIAFAYGCAVDDGGSPSNRPDSSHIGIGRQLAAFKGLDDLLRWCQIDRIRLLAILAPGQEPRPIAAHRHRIAIGLDVFLHLDDGGVLMRELSPRPLVAKQLLEGDWLVVAHLLRLRMAAFTGSYRPSTVWI